MHCGQYALDWLCSSQADKYMNRDFYDKSMKFGTQLGHAI